MPQTQFSLTQACPIISTAWIMELVDGMSLLQLPKGKSKWSKAQVIILSSELALVTQSAVATQLWCMVNLTW